MKLTLLIVTVLAVCIISTHAISNQADKFDRKGPLRRHKRTSEVYPVEWTSNPANAQCYRYFSKLLTYEDAIEDCEAHGADLAVANSAEENLFLHNLIKLDEKIGKHSTWEGIWLGGDDIKKEGSFVWLDGKKVTWSNWNPGQPNNGAGGEADMGEDCMSMRTDGKWNDLPCDVTSRARHVCTKPACPFGWTRNPATSQCYRYFSKMLTYKDAIDDCQEHGADLAVANSAEENLFLHNLMKLDKKMGKNSIWEGIWLGGDDIKNEGSFVWRDGNKFTWTNWNAGQPNNGADGEAAMGEDCVSMRTDGKWNDLPCDVTSRARHVCAKPDCS